MTINYVVCSIEESMNENLSSNNTLSNNTLNNQTRKIKEKLAAKETKWWTTTLSRMKKHLF